MQVCKKCGAEFPFSVVIEGKRLNVRGRKHCFDCRPHRPQRKPRKAVIRPKTLRNCDACGRPFALRQLIDGKLRYLYRRRFCLECSPFGSHNTSKRPPGIPEPTALREHRRRRRNATTYRGQKKRRHQRKLQLIELCGGRCVDCGYSDCPAVLEFHHRDPATKEFGIGNFGGSLARLLTEAAKCDLLCANCHRMRHGVLEHAPQRREVALRRERKARAVELAGGECYGCGRSGPPSLFEFHHWNADEKDFGISEDGILRSWERTVAELAKCVMLCANCHREVHAGVREIDDGLPGLAEDAPRYVAA